MEPTTEIARLVLVEALGSSLTPFVPIPWVDDVLLARLLRRIAGKVLGRRGVAGTTIPKDLVTAYLDKGKDPLVSRALTGAARFVIRKVAIVLDVKKSHDVFGEAIAFALAVDLAAEAGWIRPDSAAAAGDLIHTALKAVGSAPIDAVARSARVVFREKGEGSRWSRAAESLAHELDVLNVALSEVMKAEAAARGLATR